MCDCLYYYPPLLTPQPIRGSIIHLYWCLWYAVSCFGGHLPAKWLALTNGTYLSRTYLNRKFKNHHVFRLCSFSLCHEIFMFPVGAVPSAWTLKQKTWRRAAANINDKKLLVKDEALWLEAIEFRGCLLQHHNTAKGCRRQDIPLIFTEHFPHNRHVLGSMKAMMSKIDKACGFMDQTLDKQHIKKALEIP